MALNMLLCRVWAELTRTLKKTKLRRKPNTTEVAVKPDKSTGKKHINTLQCYPCACSKVSYAFKASLLSMLYDTKNRYSTSAFPSILFFCLECYHFEYKVWRSKEAGSHRETVRAIQQQRTRKSLLSPCTAEAHVHIHWALKALGHSQRTVDLFTEWLAYSKPQLYTKSNMRSVSFTCVNT